MLRTILASAVVVLASPGWAQDAPPRTATAPAPEMKVCRSIVPTGSIMAKRYCLTRAEWAKFNDINDQGSAEAFRNRRSTACGTEGSALGCD
jgi:hypothetical protein